MKPLAIDLYCGLGGWTEGLLAEGWDVIGFDIERHHYGDAKYPAQLVIQDVLTLHGRQFKDADLIVASPPCQAYSYRAMPWSRAKALPPPDNSLFEACFRIQREACEAAGRHIPLIVENVRGAQKWVGRSRWNFGSFHLWGDVPALMPMTAKRGIKVPTMGAGWYPPSHPKHVPGLDFNTHADRNMKGRRTDVGNGACFTSRDCGIEGTKGANGGWFNDNKLKGNGEPTGHLSQSGSKSNARKAASAAIAKIPLPLARYIASVFKPVESAERVA